DGIRAFHVTGVQTCALPISETGDGSPLKLKIEMNTREHRNLLGLKAYPFEIVSDWHQAKTEIVSFEPEELFGTKLRALLQRNRRSEERRVGKTWRNQSARAA